MKLSLRGIVQTISAATLMLLMTACGSTVQGKTYESMIGVRVEFQSGGKALVSTGAGTDTCSWKQKDKAVTLTCQGDSMELTMDGDDALSGPPQSFMARLTRKK